MAQWGHAAANLLAWLNLVHLAIAPVRQVNLHEAKTHLSRLVAEAVAGQGFVICKAGKPLVQVTRLTSAEDASTPPRRRLGLLAGQCSVPNDFDQIAAEEIADLFEGLSASALDSGGR
jgi:antitoxin (DNA-binding transcriptional repressor) of toxin-antitoxin stability system